MKKILFMLLAGCSFLTAAMAEEVAVKATVNSNRVSLGSGVTYTITVTGAQGLTPPEIGTVDGVDIQYMGPSTRVSVVNNAYAVEQAFNYTLIPLKDGKFTIPSITLDVQGKPFVTEPIVVEVLAQAAPNADASAEQQNIESRLKIAVALSKSRVYVGEAVPITVRLYVNQLALQDLSFPEVNQDGFQLDPFADARQMEEILNGVKWHVVEFASCLYPQRPGELVIAPVILKGNLVFRLNQRQDPGSLFDDGFFSSFFTSYQKRPVTLSSRLIRLEVAPLPEEGRPEDFSGAVGKYDFLMEASPLKVKAGDPITLRLAVAGSGNLKGVKFPEFKASGFKLYDPQVKDEQGRKLMEQVLIPVDARTTQIPSVRFSYFDAQENSYKIIERGPLAIEVVEPVAGEEFQAVGFAQGAVIFETLGKDILSIKENCGRLEKRHGFMRRNLLFYIFLAIYVQVWGGLLAFYLYRRKFLNDPVVFRRRSAARSALTTFEKAREPLTRGEIKVFYNMLMSALNEYFISRIGLIPGEATGASIATILRQKKVAEEDAAMVIELYMAAEQVCFAGMMATAEQMQRHLACAQAIVHAVERRVR